MANEQKHYDRKCDDRDYNEEGVVTPERAKRRAGVGDVNQAEKVRHDNARLVWTDCLQHQSFGQLIQRVERQREKEDKSHYQRRHAAE